MLCLVLSAPAGQAESAMVMSNLRHARFPSPDVPLCERVPDTYFDGAVLVGDSVASGLGLHEAVAGLEVLSVIGISPRTAATDWLFEHEGKACTLVQKLVALQPTMVYLWMGSNGVDAKAAHKVVDDYDRLMNKLVAALPDTLFYLIELTPVKQMAQEAHPNFTNERVDAFNEGLHGVARRHNVYVLPINALLKNDQGQLDNEYGAGDGIHLRGAAYEVLAEFLYTHTIPLEGFE